jgi:hypothetical protein
VTAAGFDPAAVVAAARAALAARGSPERAAGAKAYLKSELAFAFLAEHIDRVSSLTLREGSKYLSEAQRQQLDRMRSGSRG